MAVLWIEGRNVNIVSCQLCGDEINLTAGEHTYRHPDGWLICAACDGREEEEL